MSDKREIVTNKDNELLRPWGNEKIVIGYVEEVNGAGAMEVPEFDPTRYELIQLVKFWGEVALAIDYEVCLTRSSSSTDTRREAYAWRRINRIEAILGVDEVKKAVDEMVSEFGKKQVKRCWDVFLNGTKEQMKALQEEISSAYCERPKREPK